MGNLRTLGMLGGFTALLICVVSGPWLNAGLPGTDTVGTSLVTAGLFAVWGTVFWLGTSVDVSSGGVLAGIVGGCAALFVHGLVDFTFRVKGVVLTAAALGGVALALAAAARTARERSAGVRVRLAGWRGFMLSTAVAVSLAFVLWRGVSKPMRLAWHSENANVRVEWAGALDRLRFRVRGAASGSRIDRKKLRRILDGVEDRMLSSMADELRVALESGTDAGIREAVAGLFDELRDLSLDSLRRAWSFLRKYLDEEPGDERIVLRLAAVAESLRRGGAEFNVDRIVKDAIERCAALSPASFVLRNELGELLAAQGHLAQAAAAFEKAAALYPEKPELWLRAGDARVFSDPVKAAGNYRRALEANRLAEDERTMLYSRYWWKTPKRPRSPDFPGRLDHADSDEATPEIAFRRALMYAEIGGFADAVREMGRAIKLRPEEVQFHVFRAILLDMKAARISVADSASDRAGKVEEARRDAEAVWEKLGSVQAASPPDRQISDYTLALVRSRRGRIRSAAVDRWL